MGKNDKKYGQTSISPEFEAEIDVECQPVLDDQKPDIKVGDRVWVKSKKQGGSVYFAFSTSAIILLDSSPNIGQSYPLSDLAIQLSPTAQQKFVGQDQDNAAKTAQQKFVGQDQDKSWIEIHYRTIKGKRYGPYRVKRWRDSQGRKRSKYLGKAQST